MEEILKPKVNFELKLKMASIKTKEYYSIVKNYMLSYGLKSRMLSNKETFRKKGSIAMIKMAGKTIKVYLAIRPEPFIEEGIKVSFIDDSLEFEEYTTLIKINNKKSIETFKLVFDVLMMDKECKLKRGFEEFDYVKELLPSGEDIFNFLGVDVNIVDKIDNKSIPANLPDNIIDVLPTKDGEFYIEPYNAPIYLDTLRDHFTSDDIITRDKLLKLELIRKGTGIKIKARGVLDKPLTIFANDFDDDALKMICLTNGKAVKINQLIYTYNNMGVIMRIDDIVCEFCLLVRDYYLLDCDCLLDIEIYLDKMFNYFKLDKIDLNESLANLKDTINSDVDMFLLFDPSIESKEELGY